ncbi:hypothetical protein ACNKHR_21745 [Shigella flexneri]
MGEVELVMMLTLGANEGMIIWKVFSQLARKLVNKKTSASRCLPRKMHKVS